MMPHNYLLFFLLILVRQILVAVPPICLGLCHCDRDVVDCSSLNLHHVPPQVPSNTRVLILRNNKIRAINSSTFPDFYYLEKLDLSHNQIEFLEYDIFRSLQRLKTLNLRRNRFKQIPKGIDQCMQLDKLDLRSNMISDISSNDFYLIARVKQVDLSRNFLNDLPKYDIKTINIPSSRITKLDLTSNSIHSIEIEQFASFPSLVTLKLSKNKINNLSVNAFSRLENIQLIDLAYNFIREITFLTFKSLPSLRKVTLSHNNIYKLDDGIFYECELLNHLNLSSNYIQIITEGWLFGLESLEHLDLSYNQINSFSTNAWYHTPKLRWLSLHSNRINSLPSGSFRKLPHLEHLILSSNSIDSLHKFALVGMHNLHELDLSSNTLAVCVEDGAILYNTTMPYLRSLRFRNNELRVIPSNAFERFPSLEELDIMENPIATIHRDAFQPLHLKKLKMNSTSLLCDCQINWFTKWIHENEIDRSSIIAKCSYPVPLNGIDLIAVDSTNLTCFDDSPRVTIIEQPKNLTAIIGERARFTCNVYGEGPLMVEWRVMDKDVPRILVQDSLTFMGMNTTASINGTINGRELATADLILDQVDLKDRSLYQCVAKNRFGSDFSQLVRLQVLNPPMFNNTPVNVQLMVGENAKFRCSAHGTPRPDLKWSFGGGKQFPAVESRRLYVIPNDDHIYIMNVTLYDEGIYTCHASNEAGSIQASASLRVYDKSFKRKIESKTIQVGQQIKLNCHVYRISEDQKIVWKKNGKQVFTDNLEYFSADNQLFSINSANESDSGEYSCELWVEEMYLTSQTAHIRVLSKEEYDYEMINANQSLMMAFSWIHRINETSTLYFVIVILIIIFKIACLTSFIFFCCCSRKKVQEENIAPVFI